MSALTDRAQSFAEIQECLVKSALDLFGAYGMRVDYSLGGAAEVSGPAVMAVMGYADRGVRGALLLLASRGVVDALMPVEARGALVPVEVSLRDVFGEFANMLLGRVKNQLVARFMAPLLTTPTTVFGDDLELPAPRSGMSAWHTFAGAGGDIFVRFDATFEGDFKLSPPGAGEAPTLAEGEMVLF